MRVLVLLYVALVRSAARELCDTKELCSCDRTWGRFNCSCTATETKVVVAVFISLCTASFTVHNFYVLPTECIFVFCVDLSTKRVISL